MLEIKQRCLEHHFPEIKFFKNDMCLQGRTKWRNCRLTTKNPGYQLGASSYRGSLPNATFGPGEKSN